jgi:hypothetical protein
MNRTRRHVIQWAGAIATASALRRSAQASALRQSTQVADGWEQAVVGLFVDPMAAAAVGEAYLRPGLTPLPALASLQDAVFDVLGRDAAGRVGLEAHFRAGIRGDFEAGRVVKVDGWMLSRIEAQTCALVHLVIAGGV